MGMLVPDPPGGYVTIDSNVIMEDLANLSRDELLALSCTQEKLLNARNAVIAKIPACTAHGDQCLPHAAQWIDAQVAQRGDVIEECVDVLQGEVGRLRKLQQRDFRGSRDAQITMLNNLIKRLRSLK